MFKEAPDPRTRPNRISPWQFRWGLISAAMASACQTPAAIARWIREHRDELLAALPPALVRLPSEATIRHTWASVDSSQVDWEARRVAAGNPRSRPTAPNAMPSTQ